MTDQTTTTTHVPDNLLRRMLAQATPEAAATAAIAWALGVVPVEGATLEIAGHRITPIEPTPAWPTAKHVWWDGEVWTAAGPEEPRYESSTRAVYQGYSGVGSRFAREAVPVKLFNALTGAEVGE